jgi:2-iminobutanoate/2-iminopropanoate deaminase
MHERVSTRKVARPSGPWSMGVKTKPGELLFIAGAVSLDENGELVGPGDIEAQTHQTMRNFQAVVEAGGMRMSDVVKITTFMLDVTQYEAMARVRSQYLSEPYPASTLVEVTNLLYPNLLVEIDGIAVSSL